jgi:hypothetical protein
MDRLFGKLKPSPQKRIQKFFGGRILKVFPRKLKKFFQNVGLTPKLLPLNTPLLLHHITLILIHLPFYHVLVSKCIKGTM